MKSQSRALGLSTTRVRFPSRCHDNVDAHETTLIGVLQRGKSVVERIVKSEVEIDAIEITDDIICLVNSKENKLTKTRVIFTSSVYLAGFSIFDLSRFIEETGIPALAILRKKPDIEAVKAALNKHFTDAPGRLSLLKKQGSIKSLDGALFFQSPVISRDEALNLIAPFLHSTSIPECLRLAAMVSSVF